MNSDFLDSLNHRTALLESLDWDENQLQALLLYLHQVLNDEIVYKPEEIIDYVKINFTEEAGKELSVIFKTMSAHHNFFRGVKDEH